MTHHTDPRVDEVLSRFDVRVDEYTPRELITALRGSWEPPPDGRFVDVLLRPAFHPELLLVLHERPDGTVLWASTAQTNLFAWQPNPSHPHHNPDERPALVTGTTWPSPEAASNLWEVVSEVVQPDPHPGIGLDGIFVDIRIRLGTELETIQAWCPADDSSVGVLLKMLGHLVKEMPAPFPAIAASAGLLAEGDRPFKEYVGTVWVGDEAGQPVRVQAASSAQAAEKVKQQYGEDVHYSVYNEDDAKRRRS